MGEVSEEKKSLALAELMGWALEPMSPNGKWGMRYSCAGLHTYPLQPYKNNPIGLAQFAAILLKFNIAHRFTSGYSGLGAYGKWTQKGILDEVLLMNGVEV